MKKKDFHVVNYMCTFGEKVLNYLTLCAPAVHSRPELLLLQATSVTILQNACATLVD